MAGVDLFANTATTTLAAALTDTVGTSVAVVSSTLFPTAATGVSQFRIVIDSELMIVTNVSGTTWTVTRGTEGSTAATHLISATVTHIVTAGSLNTIDPPAGSIMMFAAATAPTGYLNCDGSSVLRATYPDLFAVIGVLYGSIDGTHFTLPNFASAFPRGNTPAATGGAASVTLSTTQLPSHNHADSGHTHSDSGHGHTQAAHGHTDIGHVHTDSGHTHSGNIHSGTTGYGHTSPGTSWLFASTGGMGSGVASIQTGYANLYTATPSINTGYASIGTGYAANAAAGSGSSVPTLPPYIGVNFIIKY